MAQPIDEYLNSGNPALQALYSKKANDQTLAALLSSSNPIQYLTGDPNVGAQNQGASGQLFTQFADYSTQKYNTTKSQLAQKGVNLDAYLDPSYQLYDPGEGTDANRGAAITKGTLLMKAQQNAIQLAMAGQKAPDYKATVLQPLLAQAQRAAELGFRDPSRHAAVTRIQNLINGYQVNAGVDPSQLAAENSWSARAEAPLKNTGAGIGPVASGGAIDNSMIGNGTNYNQLMQNAQQGIPNGVNGGTAIAPAAGNITFNSAVGAGGSYTYGGRNYSTLAAAQAAATRSGETPVYNAPGSAASTPSAPQRSNYAAGAAGDVQYQNAMDRYTAKQSGTQWTSPTNTTPPITKLADATTPDQVTNYLNSLSSAMFQEVNSASSAPPGASSGADFSSLLNGFTSGTTPGGTMIADGAGPPAFNAADTLTKLRAQYGVDPLEQDLAGIDAAIAKIQGTQFNNQQAEEAKPVALGVMGGRISEEQRQANEAMTPLIAQKTLLTNQLNQKYSVINTMMDATKSDFETAYQQYNDQFNHAIQLTTLMRGLKSDQMTADEKARDDARANLTIVTNAISSGALSWDKIDPATKAQYTKLEMQAGLPTGTVQSFTQKQGSPWVMSTVLPGVDANGNQIATIIENNKTTGEYRTTRLTTDYAPKPTSTSTQKGTYVDDKGNQVAWNIGSDGKVVSTVIGKTTAKVDPAQNAYDKLRVAVAETLSKTDSYGDPVSGSQEAAIRLIKAQFPDATQYEINKFLGSYNVSS